MSNIGDIKVSVQQGNLTEGSALVLLNASNTNAHLGSGVSGAIRAACGKGFQDYIHAELEKRFDGPMQPGQAFVTSAGTHPRAKYVVHAAVMDYREGFTGHSFPTLEVLEACYTSSWVEIESLPDPYQSIAVVAFGAGTGNVGLKKSVELACQTLQTHLQQRQNTKIGSLVFYGYELHEYLVMRDTVAAYFSVNVDGG